MTQGDYKLTILGTSAAHPTIDRNVSAYAISIDSETILFDCGEGVTRSLLQNDISINSINNIFVSHLHIDHVGGLIGLLHSMNLNGRRDSLNIHGPKKLKNLVKSGLKTFPSNLDFECNVFTVRTNFVPKVTLDNHKYSGSYVKNEYMKTSKYKISVANANHRGIAYAYRLDLEGKPGKFNVVKAEKLGVKGSNRGELVKGNSKINGRIIRPEELVGKRQPGKSFGYSGDTRPTDHLERFFKNVTCLLFDSTFTLFDQEKAKKHGHTTSYDAGRVARVANAGCLILTHFSARYKNTDDLLTECQFNYDGNVTCAVDNLKIDVM